LGRESFYHDKEEQQVGRLWLGPRVASSGETSRLIAGPLNCMLRLNVILHFSSQISIFLSTSTLKENLFGDNYWECLFSGMQCSSKCSTAQVL
jgi:hypothetical protein